VSVCRALGAHVTVAVNLNGEAFGESPAEDELDVGEPTGEGEGDEIEAAEPAPASRLQQVRQFFRRGEGEPSVFAVMARSLHIVQDRIARSRLAGDPPDVMIFPPLGGIGILEFHRAQESIAAGEAAARAAVPRLRQLVQRLEGGATPWGPRRT
jgi:NTE family protein